MPNEYIKSLGRLKLVIENAFVMCYCSIVFLTVGDFMSDHVYQRKNGKWEARYRKGKYKNGKTRYGSVFGDTREEAIARRDSLVGYDPDNPFSSSEMNVLILGAGSYGREVRKALE